MNHAPKASPKKHVHKWVSPVSFQARRLQRQFRRAGLEKHQVSLRSGSISYFCGGSGPPLVMLAGFGGSAIWQWHPQIKTLAKHHRLIIPDLLFFGDSRSKRCEHSLDAQAEAMNELLDHLRIGRTHLLGLSYGGFVAYLMASQWPERIHRLILNNSPGPVMRDAEIEDLKHRFGIERVHDLFLPAHGEQIRRLLGVAWHRAPRVPDWVLRDAHRVLYRTHIEEKSNLLTQLLSLVDDREAIQRQVLQRTLILWGAHDPVFPLHLAHRLERHIGNQAEVAVVEGAAHAPNLEKPRAFNKHILRFLSR